MFGIKKTTWEEMVSSYSKNPRDVITVPKNQKGIWFYVHTENGEVFITDAEYHAESSRVRKPIKLKKDEFEAILKIYKRKKRGEAVYQEGKKITYQQVYWYGIFADMGI